MSAHLYLHVRHNHVSTERHADPSRRHLTWATVSPTYCLLELSKSMCYMYIVPGPPAVTIHPYSNTLTRINVCVHMLQASSDYSVFAPGPAQV